MDGPVNISPFTEEYTMGFAINTNVAAMGAYRNLSNTQNQMSQSLERLSTGLRINSAADDAAGLAISEGLRSQISGLEVASRNAQDGISVVQTAEGALTEVHSILHRLRDLSVQAGNDSNNADARAAITTEANGLVEELGRIAETTNFNGINLLTGAGDGEATPVVLGAGDGTGKMTFQVGAGSTASNQIEVDLTGADIAALETRLATGGSSALDFSSAAAALTTIGNLDTEITAVSTERAKLGAVQNRFESTIKNVNVSMENLSAAESRIRDTDMAKEMADFTRTQILSQAGTAMLAQANQMNQGVLQLLR